MKVLRWGVHLQELNSVSCCSDHHANDNHFVVLHNDIQVLSVSFNLFHRSVDWI